MKNTLLVWGRFSRVVVEVSKAEVCASPGAWQSPSSQSYQCCENPLKHSEAEITIFFLSFAVCGYHHPSHQKKTDPRFNRFSIYLLESFIFRVSICTFLIFTHITCHVFNFVVVFLISWFCFGLVWGFCSVFLWFSFFTFVLLLSSFSLSDLAFPFEYSILLVQRCTNCFSRHSQNWVVRGVGRF